LHWKRPLGHHNCFLAFFYVEQQVAVIALCNWTSTVLYSRPNTASQFQLVLFIQGPTPALVAERATSRLRVWLSGMDRSAAARLETSWDAVSCRSPTCLSNGTGGTTIEVLPSEDQKAAERGRRRGMQSTDSPSTQCRHYGRMQVLIYSVARIGCGSQLDAPLCQNQRIFRAARGLARMRNSVPKSLRTRRSAR
jgi:hypothetical protein